MDEINVQVKFTKEENGIKYTDALYFPLADYANVKQEDIETEKTARFENFKQVLVTPSEVKEPTKEEVQKQIDELQSQIDTLAVKLDVAPLEAPVEEIIK